MKPTDNELEVLAIEADEEGLLLGEVPNQRAFMNVLRVLQHLGIDGVTLVGEGSPDIVKRIHTANDRLFRPIDKQEGGVHLGFFMFRDLFCRLYVPVIFGNPNIDFMTVLNLSEDQKRWMSKDAEALARFDDQALDLYDFAYGFMEFGHTCPTNDQSKELIYRAHVYLEAAAATATSAYDYCGTLQSALLGAELALKAGLACHGYDDKSLSGVGHNLLKATEALRALEPAFDADRVKRAISGFPNFVQSRYGGPQPDRLEMGHILMKAQYIASEVTRAFTGRNVRLTQPITSARSYPT